jgi:hypothetical protein
MIFNAGIKNLYVLLFGSGVFFASYCLTGKVVDKSGDAVEGASVKLAHAGMSATSGTDGTWTIFVPSAVKSFLSKKILPAPMMKGATLFFVVSNDNENIKMSIYTLDGRLLYDALDRRLSAGFYSVNPLIRTLDAKIYAIQLQVGSETAFLKMTAINEVKNRDPILRNEPAAEIQGRLAKRAVTVDSVMVSKSGYVPAVKPVISYEDSINVVLELLVPAYYLNPPHPCYNRFIVDSCKKGDPTSACGGNCTVANGCNPPESQDKANLPKTFVCPRFMLFSTEMLQAAKDDARLYGWGDSNPPFNYGVVGHDPDIGGLDNGQSTCCQCYQIVYKKPEDSSPQPPDLPYPKPLVVQSFNTQASGGKGFDVFMGAGGYGAYNACFKDPAFGNTSKFNEFIYDKYPYQNPSGGGISFLRYEKQCKKNWPPTVADVQSSECQDTIEKLCDQAFVNASPQITEDTRRSCIETNKVTSLYHQNWNVFARRVRCPENLTRVTGCRLKEDKLPLPLPQAQTPDDAKANGFSDGYHTTTMQDCCKPT